MERINHLLALKREPEYPHKQNPFKDKHTVGLSVEDVRFCYGDEGLPVLDGDVEITGVDIVVRVRNAT